MQVKRILENRFDNVEVVAYVAPDLTITPASLSATLYQGESGSATMNLANSGSSGLTYSASVDYPSNTFYVQEGFEVDLGAFLDEGTDWQISTVIFNQMRIKALSL